MTIPTWLYGVSCTKINAVAWRLAAALAACLALLAAVLTERHPRHRGGPTEGSAEPAFIAPVPSAPERTDAEATPGGQVERLVEFCSTLVNQERSFVVFANGTCVIVNEPSADPIGQALRILKDCAGPSAPFVTKEIEHGNYLVAYEKAAFHCLFFDEIEETREAIENGFRRYLGAEEQASLPADWEPHFHAKLGLVGRARLNADADTRKVARVIKARSLPFDEETPG